MRRRPLERCPESPRMFPTEGRRNVHATLAVADHLPEFTSDARIKHACHGWGAHPLYHFFASLLGIRPSSLGFDHVEISPMPGHLTSLSGDMVHPRGRIEADLTFENGGFLFCFEVEKSIASCMLFDRFGSRHVAAPRAW